MKIKLKTRRKTITIANPTRALRPLLLTLGLLLVVACGPELLTTHSEAPDQTAEPSSKLSRDHVLHFDHGYWSEAPLARLEPRDEYFWGPSSQRLIAARTFESAGELCRTGGGSRRIVFGPLGVHAGHHRAVGVCDGSYAVRVQGSHGHPPTKAGVWV